jgi:LemA protein
MLYYKKLGGHMKKKSFILLFVLLELILVGLACAVFVFARNIFPVSILLLVIALIMLITLVTKYNGIIRYKNKIKESFALIDVQLKLRFDLIPNLVSVVKKFAEHEKETLTEVTKLRNLAVNSKDEKEKLEYANKLVPEIKNIVAISENYPNLKSDTLFKSLMDQLVDVEDRIASARRIYDSNVNVYNTHIEIFPNSMIAKSFGFTREEMFRIDVGENLLQKIDLG